MPSCCAHASNVLYEHTRGDSTGTGRYLQYTAYEAMFSSTAPPIDYRVLPAPCPTAIKSKQVVCRGCLHTMVGAGCLPHKTSTTAHLLASNILPPTRRHLPDRVDTPLLMQQPQMQRI
jgi:hypothetical protein